MANLEIGIGADLSEFEDGISKVEKQLRTLERRQELRVRAGLDTGDLDTRISSARANLARLQTSMQSAGQAAQNFGRPVANAGNTLTQFSRIAQDAPFGIMGIGNNLTATAEAFAGLSRQAGGAGNALSAVASSLMGTGGILLAVSLVTTGLTVMSQKGLTVSDVFAKLTGKFDEFKQSLKEANAEAGKTSGSQVATVKALVSTAQDVSVSMRDRLIAVKELQDTYPAYFGNLSKEQVLNGNVAGAVDKVTEALIAKAKAQVFADKIGVLAGSQVELRQKETELLEKYNAKIRERKELEKKLSSEQFNEATFRAFQRASIVANGYKDDLIEIQDALRGNFKETRKWQDELNKETKLSIATEFEPPKIKKVKELQTQINTLAGGLKPVGLTSLIKVDSGIFTSDIGIGKDMDAFITRLNSAAKPMSTALFDFWMGIKGVQDSLISNVFGGIGDSIGAALASGANVIQAVGMSIVASMGEVLSSIGDKLIALGAASLLASTVFATFGSVIGVGAALAAIAGGVALKAGGSFLSNSAKGGASGSSKNSTSVSAGNSVQSPTSSVNSGSGGGGWGNVVFEISGQSLVGVLSNTLNKNVKLGGAMPAI